MLKTIISMIAFCFVADAADVNYSGHGIVLRSITETTAEPSAQIIASYNAFVQQKFGENAIQIGAIVPANLKRKENGNAWHLQVVYAGDLCVGLLAFGKIPTSYIAQEHEPLNSAFRDITASEDPMANCVWAFAENIDENVRKNTFLAMVDYAKSLKQNKSPLPLTEVIPSHLFVLTSIHDHETQGFLTEAGLTLSQADAWTLFYDRPRVAGYINL